jgi:hypothetical protein
MLDTQRTLGDLEALLERRQQEHALELVNWVGTPDALRVALGDPHAAHTEPITIVPDAVAIVRTAAGSIALVLDVDTGTLSMKRMRQRYEAYVRWWEHGGAAERFDVSMVRVLVITAHTHRLARLRDAAHGVASGRARHLFWFATSAAFDEGAYAASIAPD